MKIDKIKYRKLNKYKYQLRKGFSCYIPLEQPKDIRTEFIRLDTNGYMYIKINYAWDGPSGPTIDTKTFMRGALVHDALYQLMREKHIDHKKYRKQADIILRDICKADG